MLGFILGTMTGGVMGVFAMCLFIAGKREDEALERCRMKPKEIIDHGVCICFVNSQGEELFRLADGESLVQNAPNGAQPMWSLLLLSRLNFARYLKKHLALKK